MHAYVVHAIGTVVSHTQVDRDWEKTAFFFIDVLSMLQFKFGMFLTVEQIEFSVLLFILLTQKRGLSIVSSKQFQFQTAEAVF